MKIFIYCNWVSTQWQWSVDLYKNRKETAQKEKQYKSNTKQRIHKIEEKYTKRKQTKNEF
jgi:hypothetical protein